LYVRQVFWFDQCRPWLGNKAGRCLHRLAQPRQCEQMNESALKMQWKLLAGLVSGLRPLERRHFSVPGKAGPVMGSNQDSVLGGPARPLPPSADIGPRGQSFGQAAQFRLAVHVLLGCCKVTRPTDYFPVVWGENESKMESKRGCRFKKPLCHRRF
jgi:hypothetical protein